MRLKCIVALQFDTEIQMSNSKNPKHAPSANTQTKLTYGKRRLFAFACLTIAASLNIQQPAMAASGGARASAAVFDKDGQLKRPTGYREWIFLGAPVTPNDMNDGKAAFPEFHNVYLDPSSWAYWKKHGEFRDGTIITKELVSVGSKSTFSGKGYFEGEYIGLEAMVKDKKRFPDAPGNWAFFRFTIEGSKALKSVAAAQAPKDCSACHQPNAAQDSVFIQHYPVLRAGKAAGRAAAGGF